MKDPYKEADGISMTIMELHEENPINSENVFNWVIFCKAIASVLKSINDEAIELLLEEMHK